MKYARSAVGWHPAGDPPCMYSFPYAVTYPLVWSRWLYTYFSFYYFPIMSTSVALVRRFDYGSLFTSATVFNASCEHIPFGEFVRSCIARHLLCDWGDCCPDDATLNDAALVDGSRIFSVYHIPSGLYHLDSKIWIITESSREYTTVIFPSEY